jgi:uncharacterized membrane protein
MSATGTQAGQEPLDAGLKLVLPGRSTPAGAGWDWVARGWSLFTAAPLMWILSIVVLVIVAIVLALIPIVGQLIFQLAQGVFAAGFVAACRSIEVGGEFEIEHLFAGFKQRFGPLLIVGLILLGGWIVIVLVFVMIAGLSLLGAFMSGDPNAAMAAMAASVLTILLGVLVMLALMVPLLAAYWFAPALVMMHNMQPLDAMKASFFACFRNFVPFLVYGLVMMVAGIIAVIPFGLGMLVWVPVAITSTYVAYRQIFTEDAPQAQSVQSRMVA